VTGTGEPGATVDVEVDGVLIGDDIPVDADGNFSVPGTELDSALPEGEHTVRVVQTDSSGNASRATTSTFTVDSTAPAVPVITSPGNGDVVEDTAPITGTAEPGSTVTVLIDEQVAGQVVAGDDGTFTFTPEPGLLSDGAHRIRAFSTDAAGNESGLSDPVTVTVVSQDDGDGDGGDDGGGDPEAGSPNVTSPVTDRLASTGGPAIWATALGGLLVAAGVGTLGQGWLRKRRLLRG
jgi:hypothetical protein